ncbi:hypothetical protein ACCO45_005444 [Purpureocillium lilacinum]|uniref:Uncharacterized protein n=1 Tax=Purpureocillium lilacinum TaxID=33203 RepID=A0ACC4DW67_PURLI
MPPCHASRRITHGAPSTSTTAVLTVTSFRNVTFVRDTRHRRPRARMRSVAHRPAVCCPAAHLHMLVPSRPHAAAANSRKGVRNYPLPSTTAITQTDACKAPAQRFLPASSCQSSHSSNGLRGYQLELPARVGAAGKQWWVTAGPPAQTLSTGGGY